MVGPRLRIFKKEREWERKKVRKNIQEKEIEWDRKKNIQERERDRNEEYPRKREKKRIFKKKREREKVRNGINR